MNNRDIFIQEYPAHSSRTVQLADGGMAYPYSALAVGRIEGLYRSLPALMSDDATNKDNWYVVNIDDDTTNGHIQAVAVLGATSEDQAKSWAIKTIGVHLNASPRAWNIALTSAKALKNFLDRSASRGSFAISQTMLDTIAKQITDTPVKWLSQDSCQLASHNGNTSELLHELVKQDDQAQLVDSMNSADLACLLAELGAEEEDYNAIVVQYAKFDDFINRMNQAMGKAAVNKLSIANFTKTKPFKRNNVVNIALLWDLSDGQSMTIVFHNPDSTPSKLQAGDILTSWKFMLNKRDITAAVSPEQGKNAQPTVIAQRMMLIAEKNSARFVRTNAKKDEKVKALSELELANENTQNEIARILAQNEALQKEIDAVVAQNANSPSVIQERPKDWRTNLANARDVAKSLGIETKGKKLERLVKDIDIFDDNEVKKELLAEFKALAGRLVLPKGYMFDLSGAEKSINNAGVLDLSAWIKKQGKTDTNSIRIELRTIPDSSQGVIFNSVHFYTDDKKTKTELDKLNYPRYDDMGTSSPTTPKTIVAKMEEFLTKAVFPKIEYLKVMNSTNVDVSKLPEIGIAEITDIGNENIYFEKDGKHYISKVGNPQLYALGEWDFAKYPDGKFFSPELSNKKSVFEALTQYGWSLDTVSGGISKTFAGLAEAGSISDGSRTLSAYFDSRERYLAVTDNNAPTGGAIITETEIDLRDYGYNTKAFEKAAKAFNEKVEAYVLKRRELVNTPTSNLDRDFLQSIIDGKDTGLEPKAITAKIRQIVVDAKGKNDTEILVLADQAAKAYAAQVKAKAAAKLAEVQ